MPAYDSDRRRRSSLRLQGYDYSRPGAYFITVCTEHRLCLFGDVVDTEMELSDAGWVMQTTWESLPQAFPLLGIDVFGVVPNHLHGILTISQDEGGILDATAPGRSDDEDEVPGLISQAMKHYKAVTTAEYAFGVKHYDWAPFPGRLWQRGFHDHIIRGERDWERVRRYIINNPVRWAYDRENPRRDRSVPADEWPFDGTPPRTRPR